LGSVLDGSRYETLIYQKWYISISGSELRKIPALFTAILVPLIIPAPPIFLTSTNSHPTMPPQVPVSSDTYPANTRQLRLQSHGIIDCSSTNLQRAAENSASNLKAANRAMSTVNAYGSPATQTPLPVFEKAFNVPVHAPPSSEILGSTSCPIKPTNTSLNIAVNPTTNPGVLVCCAALANPTCHIIPGTSASTSERTAIIALANQQCVSQGHGPQCFNNAAFQNLAGNSACSKNLHDITQEGYKSASTTPSFSATSGYDTPSGWGTPNPSNPIPDLANSIYS
jgi:hypothetical protein